MAYREASAPSSFYPKYPTLAAYEAGQKRHLVAYMDCQKKNVAIYLHIKDATDEGCMNYVMDEAAYHGGASGSQPSQFQFTDPDNPAY
ncbi:hypothetical protein TSUD_145050 [Trifolium subterraneum]|uniref:Uncharacterized protein n=1 Tax=Trifolium subterraneum TaxID=3900 RepID=A0A2Z6PA50_TRISU|nr:hypothetical protein TSUD_145050 [Trifolium subterraneum]